MTHANPTTTEKAPELVSPKRELVEQLYVRLVADEVAARRQIESQIPAERVNSLGRLAWNLAVAFELAWNGCEQEATEAQAQTDVEGER